MTCSFLNMVVDVDVVGLVDWISRSSKAGRCVGRVCRDGGIDMFKERECS